MKKITLVTLAFTVAGSMMAASPTTKLTSKADSKFKTEVVTAKPVKVDTYSTKQVNQNLVSSQNVISSFRLNKGGKINVVKSAEGVSRKVLVTNSVEMNKISAKKGNVNRTKAVGATTFAESFDGWDGETRDWIPANWQDVSKAGNAVTADNNLTWAVDEPYFFSALDGDYVAFIPCDMPVAWGGTAKNQDEWLITPAFVPQANDIMFAYMHCAAGWFTINYDKMNAGVYEFDAKNGDLEILVSEDNGTNWTSIFSACSDIFSKMSADELLMTASGFGDWYPLSVSLDAYNGKSIKVAYRYTAKEGLAESVSLDMIEVRQAQPAAYYLRPEGNLYATLTDDLYSPARGAIIHGPAYVDDVWRNWSNIDATSFSWSYDDQESTTGGMLTSTDFELTTNYPYGLWYLPTLTASAPNVKDSVYTQFGDVDVDGYLLTGHQYSEKYSDGNSRTFPSSNYTLDKPNGGITLSSLFAKGSDAQWTGLFGLSGDDKIEVTSFGQFFEQPAHSYALSAVTLNAMCVATADAELTLTIHKVNEDGKIGDVITTSTASLAEVAGDGKISTIVFEFMDKDPITGLEQAVDLTIDSAIYMTITGFESEKISKFSPLWPDGYTDNSEVYGYIGFNATIDGTVTPKLYSTDLISYKGNVEGESIYCTAFMFNLYTTFTWLEVDPTQNTEFSVPDNGGEMVYNINSYTYVDSWSVLEEDEGTLPEWLTYEAIESTDTEDAKLKLIAEALPADVAGRSTKFTLSIPGSKIEFFVTQGTGGVSSVKINPVKVSTTDGDFTISYPSSVSSVNIYNVAGQLVATKALAEGGKDKVAAKDMAKGLYVLRFNDNTVVKAIK